MRFDHELRQLADLLRVGADTARTIAGERARDEIAIQRLAAQAERMAAELDRIVGGRADEDAVPSQLAAGFRLRRDR